MFKSQIFYEIAKIYERGENIMWFIKNMEKNKHNSKDAILISYDFQAGSYVDHWKNNASLFDQIADQYVTEIRNCGLSGGGGTILEAGVGEATTFINVIRKLGLLHGNCYGFDISWSRLKVANDFLNQNEVCGAQLFVGDLTSIPLCDNSIDIVYTSHTIEPNGGQEKPILEELYRVARNYLILFEPDYELAGYEARARMDKHGYVKNLQGVAVDLGYDVVKHKLLDICSNPLNPTSVMIIKKSDSLGRFEGSPFRCPNTKQALLNCGEVYFAPDSYLMYPVIQGLPCLLENQAILGCKYEPAR